MGNITNKSYKTIAQINHTRWDEEENDSPFSVKDFLQSNGDTTGLMEIKAAIEDLKTPLKPILDNHQSVCANESSHSLVACGVPCKSCYQEEWTKLKAAIQKIHKITMSNVHKL